MSPEEKRLKARADWLKAKASCKPAKLPAMPDRTAEIQAIVENRSDRRRMEER